MALRTVPYSGGTVPKPREQFMTISASSQNLKLIYATLLSAQMAGRSVTLTAQANSTGCTIRYVTSP